MAQGFTISEHTLANGLRVVLSPDHSAPTAVVAVYYGIGFRNERISEDVDIGTVRVNYTFGGPAAARY